MSLSISSRFGAEMKRLRQARQLTQHSLSQQTGLSKSYISFLESNIRHPSRDAVLNLAQVMRLSESEQDGLLSAAGYLPLHLLASESSDAITLPEQIEDFLKQVLGHIRKAHYQEAKDLIDMGFQRYERPAQMQTLLAHLALAKHEFAHAVLSQETALKHAQLHELSAAEIADYWLNLGVMYFLWGDHERAQASSSARALEYYALALNSYLAGLQLEPDNLYLCDEVGRAHINLADLHGKAAVQKEHWKQAQQFLRAVLAHPQKAKLKPEDLLTSSVFLALSYAKLNKSELAFLLLDTLECQFPMHWLLHYIRACCLCLSEAPREIAWLSLKQALVLNPDIVFQVKSDLSGDLRCLSQYPPLQESLQNAKK